jgi:hypothetical protein
MAALAGVELGGAVGGFAGALFSLGVAAAGFASKNSAKAITPTMRFSNDSLCPRQFSFFGPYLSRRSVTNTTIPPIRARAPRMGGRGTLCRSSFVT